MGKKTPQKGRSGRPGMMDGRSSRSQSRERFEPQPRLVCRTGDDDDQGTLCAPCEVTDWGERSSGKAVRNDGGRTTLRLTLERMDSHIQSVELPDKDRGLSLVGLVLRPETEGFTRRLLKCCCHRLARGLAGRRRRSLVGCGSGRTCATDCFRSSWLVCGCLSCTGRALGDHRGRDGAREDAVGNVAAGRAGRD